jgi:uncharacterized protein
MTRIAHALSRTAAAAAIVAASFAGLSAQASTRPADVRIEPVTFTSGGQTLKGHLYIPSGVSRANPGSAVVVTGAWMTVKEQMPGRYAQELAQRGVVALAFDFRGWGESGGAVRALEDPKAKTEDIRAAVAFLATRSEVDPQAISGLGICASAGYMAEAAATTPAMRSVALVAPWLHDRAIVNAVYGGEASVQSLIEVARKAQARFEATGQQTLVPAASSTDSRAVMFNVPYYTERDRGLIPQWENQFNVASWEAWLSFDAMPAAPRLKAPLLVVHSEAAAIPQGARQFYAAVTAPKQQLWLDNVSQFDFYDRAPAVTRAADAAAQHFKASRSAAGPGRTPGSPL